MLGRYIRQARLHAGLTQEDVAYRAHIGRPHLSHVEHDKKSPTVDVLVDICKAIGVKPAMLFSRADRNRIPADTLIKRFFRRFLSKPRKIERVRRKRRKKR